MDGLTLHAPAGCNRCSGGYKGRFALLETMVADEDISRLVVQGASALEIKEHACKHGMITLRRCGLLNVLRGKTSVEEVLRVTMSD